MDRNRTAQVFYTIGFMLGGVFGFISGIVTSDGNDTLLPGFIGMFIGSAAILIAPQLSKNLNN